ncbi:MAG: alpha-glucosidase/alpha-galactosidase [Armatimonadetes bacterium]|nr:alpha-glucosidase/alpha-galactosidase [Armatimonadota bacterium]
MRNVKIVLIGVGSASFGLGALSDLVNIPCLKGSTVCLVDIDSAALEAMGTIARKMNDQADAGLNIEQTTDRTRALPDADFVVISIAVRRNELWKLDFEIPLKYGVKQVLGENGGPGGLFHAMRNIPIILDICHDIERLCPNALVFNFTNPVPRISMAVNRYTNVSFVGLCHGIAGELWRLSKVMEVDQENLDAKAAGLNHFTWILDLRFKDTGEDAYPLLREKLEDYDPSFQPLSRKMFDTFGYYPSPGDDHIGEYLPFAWEYCGLKGFDFAGSERYKADISERIARILRNDEPVTPLIEHRSGERAFSIIEGIITNSNHVELAVNIPNDGLIPNLPMDAIVEVPAVISGAGISGISVGALPAGIAAMCNTQIGVQELVVDAAVTGSRQIALQALLADPVVNSVDSAEKILDELLALEAAYLPQFQK